LLLDRIKLGKNVNSTKNAAQNFAHIAGDAHAHRGINGSEVGGGDD
jgi:hypothetical protein